MKHNFKNKALGISVLALLGGTLPSVASCSNTSEFFTVKNNKGLEIEFCDVGASIYSIKYNNTYLTYHPKDKDIFMNKDAIPYYYGKTLGRVAGRFADGEFTIGSKTHKVQVNETGKTKNNCLHGGKDAFSFKTFKRWVLEDELYTKVAFNYLSPAYEASFPGSVDVWVVYTLYKNENKLDTDLFAKPSEETVLNLSTHSLFRLGNDGNVLDYKMTIPATKRAVYDKESEKATNQVVIGTKDVEDIFNFAGGKKIGQDILKAKEYDPISNGYDHIWYVGNLAQKDRYVELYNPANKINFKVSANCDKVTGFIIYSNDYPRDNQIMQGDDKQDTQYAGITVEPYTYFSKTKGSSEGQVGIEPILYTPDNPFYTSYSYEISEK